MGGEFCASQNALADVGSFLFQEFVSLIQSWQTQQDAGHTVAAKLGTMQHNTNNMAQANEGGSSSKGVVFCCSCFDRMSERGRER